MRGLTGMVSRHRWFRPGSMLCVVVVCACVAGCSRSPARHRADADKEVYGIIDSKWHERLGGKANYVVSGFETSPNDVTLSRPAVTGRLTLAEAVAVATAANRDYQRQKEDLYLVALDLTLERHQFAYRWLGTVDSRYVNDPLREGTESSAGAGLSRALAGGAVITTNIATDWLRFLSGDPTSSLRSLLSATITQPLLRGYGRQIAQEGLTQAERNVLYQIRSFNRYRKTFVVSIADDYYRVLQLRDVVMNAENDYERRIDARERLRMEAQAGRRDSYEVDQAEQDALRAQNNVVGARERYEQQLDQFKIRLSLPADAEVELDPNELETLRRVEVIDPDYTLEEAIDTALARRLDLANQADAVEDAARKVALAADNIRGELNLVGGTSVSSREGVRFTRVDPDDGSYNIGLEGDLPFDRKAERNVYRQSLIALERQRREYENAVDMVKLNVREAYRQLRQQAESYRITKNSLTLAEKRVESTSMLLQAGRATTRDLLESQDALLEAQNDLTSALISHTVAKMNFFRDIGLLQVQPDGMWEHPEIHPRATVHASPADVAQPQPDAADNHIDFRDFLAEPERLWESL